MKLIIPIVAVLTASSLLTAPASGLLKASASAEISNSAALASGTEVASSAEAQYEARRTLYDKLSVVTGVPWYWLAAIDQYERSISKVRPKDRPMLGSTVGVFVGPEHWSGFFNPDHEDSSPVSIQWFKGIGRDGDGDGHAMRTSDIDLMYSLVHHIASYGTSDDDFSIGLWEYYQSSRAVQRIQQFARIYKQYDTLDLFEHAFPLPVGNNYSYRDTWGYKRSWGGRRTHEGTDIFAGHGTPVRSTCYGIIEVRGWNRFGGWRVGIRDLNNYYHYYAHLSGFDNTISIGDIVKPGQVIGWVGSSGYGKPGTQGKFPPHLHYGIYSDRGLTEWSFDPFPMLKRWEQAELKRIRSNQNS